MHSPSPNRTSLALALTKTLTPTLTLTPELGLCPLVSERNVGLHAGALNALP